LFEECPFVGAYYCDTATPNDGFASVTSPLGYAYPDLWQNDVWNGARDSSRSLMDRFHVSDIYGYKHYAAGGQVVYRGKTISNSFNFPRYGQFQSAINAHLTIVYDPLLPSQVPVTTYGPLMFNHVGDGSFYGDASNLSAMAARIVNALRPRSRPSFLLAGYQRFRQDDFGSRPSPASSDISIPRLAQVVQMILADTAVGPFVEVVTPEKFSILMRKYTGLIASAPAADVPASAQLLSSYPNPFNPVTTVEFRIPMRGWVTLKTYDPLGREVAVLVNEEKSAGTHRVRWDASRHAGLAAGVYFSRLTFTSAESRDSEKPVHLMEVHKIVLLK
jgi:hypothetical protein